MRRLTKKEIELKLQQVLEKLRTEVTPFEDDSEEAREERKRKAEKDVIYFFKTYLPHYFTLEFAPFHYELVSLLGVKGTPIAIKAPREHAKSTIVSFGYPLKEILFKGRRFIVIVSDTKTQAELFTRFIKLELEENERIKADFGDLRGVVWAEDRFITSNDVFVLARGRGQKIRGMRHRQHRPDLVILDDIENDKSVKNPKIVKETLKWIREAVMGSIARGGLDGTLFVIGTLLSKKSVLAELLKDPEWISKEYSALSEDGIPLWPAKFTKEDLDKIKRKIGSIAFSKEYQGNPRDEEGAFREEWIRYYHQEELINKELIKVSFVDPSVGSGESNDYKAVITIGKDLETGIIYVLDAFIKKSSIDQLLRVVFNRYREHNPFVIGFESNGFQSVLADIWEKEVLQAGYTPPIKLVDHRINKEIRIISLSPLIERGLIRFQKGHSDQEILIEQLIYFPESTVNDDGPDALEGAVSLLKHYSNKFEYMTTRKSSIKKRVREVFLNG